MTVDEEKIKKAADEARALAALLHEDITKLTSRSSIAWGAVCLLAAQLWDEMPGDDADRLARLRLMCDSMRVNMKLAEASESPGPAPLRHRGPRVFRRRG